MPQNQEIVLRCHKIEEGVYSAEMYDQGNKVNDDNFRFAKGGCEELRALLLRATEEFKVVPTVVGDCIECFPFEVLKEAEAVAAKAMPRD